MELRATQAGNFNMEQVRRQYFLNLKFSFYLFIITLLIRESKRIIIIDTFGLFYIVIFASSDTKYLGK